MTPYLSVADTAPDFAVASGLQGLEPGRLQGGADRGRRRGAQRISRRPSCAAGATPANRRDRPFSRVQPSRDWLDAAIAGIDANRHALADLLETHLPQAGYRLPESTYLAWIDCRELGLGDDPAAAFLEGAGLRSPRGQASVRAAPASCGSTSRPHPQSSRRRCSAWAPCGAEPNADIKQQPARRDCLSHSLPSPAPVFHTCQATRAAMARAQSSASLWPLSTSMS